MGNEQVKEVREIELTAVDLERLKDMANEENQVKVQAESALRGIAYARTNLLSSYVKADPKLKGMNVKLDLNLDKGVAVVSEVTPTPPAPAQ